MITIVDKRDTKISNMLILEKQQCFLVLRDYQHFSQRISRSTTIPEYDISTVVFAGSVNFYQRHIPTRSISSVGQHVLRIIQFDGKSHSSHKSF